MTESNLSTDLSCLALCSQPCVHSLRIEITETQLSYIHSQSGSIQESTIKMKKWTHTQYGNRNNWNREAGQSTERSRRSHLRVAPAERQMKGANKTSSWADVSTARTDLKGKLWNYGSFSPLRRTVQKRMLIIPSEPSIQVLKYMLALLCLSLEIKPQTDLEGEKLLVMGLQTSVWVSNTDTKQLVFQIQWY